jgi:hypothetical protein
VIVTRDGNKIIIELDQPWERETAQWLLQTYGPDFIKKHFVKLLYNKQRAKKFMGIQSQMEE